MQELQHVYSCTTGMHASVLLYRAMAWLHDATSYSHTPAAVPVPSQDLRAKLLAEAEQSARNNASVAMRWADLFSIEVPQVRCSRLGYLQYHSAYRRNLYDPEKC